MKIHWIYLFVSLVLLVPPTPYPADFRKALRRSNVNHPGAVTRVWQNWFDLIRAAIGVYLLTQNAIVVPPGADSTADFKALGLQAVVLCIVLLTQTIRTLRTVQLLAPVCYLCGLTLIMGGFDSSIPHVPVPLPLSGAFAVVVGWLFALGGQNLAYQMPAMAVAAAVAGSVLGPRDPLIVNCGLILMPLVLSILMKKRLWFAANAPVGA